MDSPSNIFLPGSGKSLFLVQLTNPPVMKKLFYFLSSILFIAAVALLFINATYYSTGAPEGYTGSPWDGADCSACHIHMGTPVNVNGIIDSNVGPEGYVPGNSYVITVTVPGIGIKGFEASPQKNTGELLGTMVPGNNAHLVGSGTYITHDAALSDTISTWTFTWIAPNSNAGDVNFYCAATVGQNDVRLQKMTIHQKLSAIAGNAEPAGFTVFYSAGNNSLILEFTLVNPENISARLLDSYGKNVYDLVIKKEFQPGQHSLAIALPYVPARGLYLARFMMDEKILVKKILIR
jgi:hypothetical protein